MKQCAHCSDPVEAEHYSMCKSCWWERDPRNNKRTQGMTLLEAIATGKRFKRNRWTNGSWIKIQDDSVGSLYFPSTGVPFQISVDDLKADDYVIRDETKVECALRELNEAMVKMSEEEIYFLIKDIQVNDPEQYSRLERAILKNEEEENKI